MFRIVAWSVLALFLLLVGAWPAAVAPVALAGAGLAAVIGAVPGPVLVLAAVAVYLHRRAPRTA